MGTIKVEAAVSVSRAATVDILHTPAPRAGPSIIFIILYQNWTHMAPLLAQRIEMPSLKLKPYSDSSIRQRIWNGTI